MWYEDQIVGLNSSKISKANKIGQGLPVCKFQNRVGPDDETIDKIESQYTRLRVCNVA